MTFHMRRQSMVRIIFRGRRSIFGDVGVSLFVAGAVFGEIWAKCCNFQYKMRLRSAKSNLGERAGAR